MEKYKSIDIGLFSKKDDISINLRLNNSCILLKGEKSRTKKTKLCKSNKLVKKCKGYLYETSLHNQSITNIKNNNKIKNGIKNIIKKRLNYSNSKSISLISNKYKEKILKYSKMKNRNTLSEKSKPKSINKSINKDTISNRFKKDYKYQKLKLNNINYLNYKKNIAYRPENLSLNKKITKKILLIDQKICR